MIAIAEVSMRFSVVSANVSHERMQDEVIIINMVSGAYYSGSGPAADFWTLISGGASIEETARTLADAYGADPAIVSKDVEAAAGTLETLGLVIRSDPGAAVVADHPLPDAERGAWAIPTFDEYTDMWDLLQADPIHDVGEAGWPFAVPKKA